MTNTEITIQSEANPVITRARAITIIDDTTMAETVELLSRANKTLDAIKIESDKVILPAKQVIDAETNRWKATVTGLKEIVLTLRTKQGAYQTEMNKKAEIEKQKIAERIGEGSGKLKVETAVRKINEVVVPQKKVVASSGSLSFRKDPIIKVTDADKIPREFLVINESYLLASLKAGKRVEGAELDYKMTPINKR